MTLALAHLAGCGDDDPCYGTGLVPDIDGGCVAPECTTDAECSADAPRCDTTTHTCVGCTDAAECTRFTGLGLCDDGACVQCTVADESACGASSCSALTRTCTTTARGSRGLCATCEADSECSSGAIVGGTLRCVPVSYEGIPRGNACLLDTTTLIGPSCTPGYISVQARTSVSGVASTYCVHAQDLTTCEAIRGFRSTCTADDECGAATLDDAFCRDDGANLRCSYVCSANDDCLDGFRCNVDAAPRYCCTDSPGTGPCAPL